MTLTQRITREPALVLGLVTAGLSLAVLFGAPISAEQIAGVGIFLGAAMALARYLTVPADEVLAQSRPDGVVVAGPASSVPTGDPVDVVVRRVPPTG